MQFPLHRYPACRPLPVCWNQTTISARPREWDNNKDIDIILRVHDVPVPQDETITCMSIWDFYASIVIRVLTILTKMTIAFLLVPLNFTSTCRGKLSLILISLFIIKVV